MNFLKQYKVQMSLKQTVSISQDVQNALPFLSKSDHLLAEIIPTNSTLNKNGKSLRIGVCYCSRQSPGGNNVVDGLLDYASQ